MRLANMSKEGSVMHAAIQPRIIFRAFLTFPTTEIQSKLLQLLLMIPDA